MKFLGICALVCQCEALFFKIEAKGTAKAECFWVEPSFGHWIVGSYEASGASEGVICTISHVSGGGDSTEVWKSTDTATHFSVSVQNEGKHKLCFDTTVDNAMTISFNLRVDEDFPATDKTGELVTKDHTDKVSELIAKLNARAADIIDQQEYAITRESVHRSTAESTNSRVVYWTVSEAICLVCLASFQVYYLKSFFEVKQVI